MRVLYVFSLVTVFMLCSLHPAYAVRIKVATKAPENFRSAQIIKEMFGEIRKKTDGNVVFKVYFGGVKGTGRDLLLKMKSGEIHGAEFMSVEASSVCKDLELLSAPLTFRDYQEVDYVLEKISGHLEKQLRERGYVVLGWLEVGFAHMMSVEPVESVQDLKNRKVWIPEGESVGRAVFEAIGVPPVTMSIADVILALQTGQIDTVANSYVGSIALQWHTGIKYITDTPILYAYGPFMITQEAYDTIPAKYREMMHEIMDRYFHELKVDIRNSNRDSAKTLISEGIKFLHPSEEKLKEFEGVVQEVKDRLFEKEFPGEGLVKLRQYINEYRTARPEGK